MLGAGTESLDYAWRKSIEGFTRRVVLFAGVLVLLMSILLPVTALAQPAGAGTSSGVSQSGNVGERFGVASSHLKLFDPATMEGEFQAMQEAGIAWVRCDFAWYDLEPVQGAWDFSGSDLVVEKASSYGIEILGILGTSPPWASDGGEGDWNYPPNEEHIPDWRNYIQTVAARYQGRVSAWEIWNEQNIHAFWMPEPDSEYYMQLLQVASEEIRIADPAATIVMGGVAGLGSTYLDECLEAGAAEYVDAIAYHPYPETIGVEGQPEEDRYRPKEELCRLLVDVFVPGLLSKHQAEHLEIWLTEFGWTTCEESPPGVDYDTQASYMLRSLINYAGTGMDKAIWYNLRDEMMHPVDYLGILENDFTPKPSHAYYTTFMDVFGTAVAPSPDAVSFTCSDPSTLEAHCFALPDGGIALAAWKSDDLDDSLTFTVEDPSLCCPRSVDPLTRERVATPGAARGPEGRIVVQDLPIGKNPAIIELEPLNVTSITPNQAQQNVIAMEITDLAGSGFEPGATVRLEMGEYTAHAYNVNVVSSSKITCTIGFFAVTPGTYDVVVQNPNGQEARLQGGFTVTSPCGAGSGTAVLMFGLTLGLLSMAASTRMKVTRRGRRER